MVVDRYLVGNQIVSDPSMDTTKTIEEYLVEHKKMQSECKLSAMHMEAAKSEVEKLKFEIKELNEIIVQLKKQIPVFNKK